ncbi:molybdopterin-synthase adenylyltransferase MoeB [Cellulomonas sp. PhB150]|uniref:molybdopterin-synthase adenylyltransferase MoeB n=1 Tax=Cellulomonas sp. PhB150 TaxID=2485188 RepID=UPI000F4732FA|nr:molybdopterin-synthase adenylyltransferase MoeB [Cellulomonas sp. PhB150]ROS26171.1 adenylyltransferase/sulfurtransferase [Cellulomonas sp. PhB150]
MIPLVAPGPPLTPEQTARASRHLLLPGIGVEGQRRLRAARVLVVGAGGLGAPVLQYLAAAGIGTLGVVDDDVVDVSNLQRQVIHGTADVGRLKVDSARGAIADLDPSVAVETHAVRLTAANADAILGAYDLVVDGTDNFPTRYLVSDACERLGLPVVWGSVLRFDAQVSVFWSRPPAGPGVTLRDLFPTPPAPDEVPSCAEAGVIGALCGQVGSVLATEVVKLVTGVGEPLLGRVLVIDALRARWSEVPLVRSSGRRAVDGPDAVSGASVPDDGAVTADGAPDDRVPTISAAALALRLADPADPLVLVDVREPAEAAQASIPGARLIPLGRVMDGSGIADLPRDREVVVHCAVGGRSLVAAEVLRAAGVDATNLEGGIHAWLALP